MLSDKIQAAFNTQVGQEFSNSIAYIAIANYFKSENLNGLAKMFYKQAAEEHTHAMKFTEFLLDTGCDVKIPAIAAPQNSFASAEAAAQLALDAEIRTTNQINDLLTLALAEKDYAAFTPGLTAHRIVNAVPMICEAPLGIRTTLELPHIIATF